jgi:hypothetical protein
MHIILACETQYGCCLYVLKERLLRVDTKLPSEMSNGGYRALVQSELKCTNGACCGSSCSLVLSPREDASIVIGSSRQTAFMLPASCRDFSLAELIPLHASLSTTTIPPRQLQAPLEPTTSHTTASKSSATLTRSQLCNTFYHPSRSTPLEPTSTPNSIRFAATFRRLFYLL